MAALRAALVVTSQREAKQKENPAYYKVVSVLFLSVSSKVQFFKFNIDLAFVSIFDFEPVK